MDKTKRNALIAGNWKMNMLASQVPAFWQDLEPGAKLSDGVCSALCVPFPLIPAAKAALAGSQVAVGAQDVSAHDKGAYTGEVSAAMLADLGVDFCIIGHSERRAYHNESDELVNAKLKALLGAGITPIMCCGESLEQRDAGVTLSFVESQIKGGLAGVTAEEMKKVVIAYEPIWAIGTGRTATAEQAQEVCGYIRGVLAGMYGEELAKGVQVLYGGSMNGSNAAELLAQPDIDGGLIGGASLKMEFADIIGAANE